MAHRASQIFEDSLFDGDENAIVDFKYSSNPKLTWWFDHHQSAFLTPGRCNAISRRTARRKKMYDPSFKSCTNFISTMAKKKWGFAAADLDDLVHWANIIDGAQYPDPKTAVELGAPAMKLTLVIESSKGSEIVQRIIGYMQRMPLAEIVAQPDIQELFKPLYERHLKSVEYHSRQGERIGRRDHIRSDRLRSGGLQQVHPVLSVSARHLYGVGKPVELPDEDFGRIESLGA